MLYEELLSLARKRYSSKNDKVLVCVAAGCLGLGSDKILKKLKKKFTNYEVKQVGCIGLCSGGPLIRIEPEGTVVSLKDIKHIDQVVEKIISLKGKVPEKKPFFEKQLRVVLENSGLIDPECIEDYIVHNGYRALFNVLSNIAPEKVVLKITNSGLRGRGGGGYPTGLKWNTVAKMDSKIKYVVCNADEGDPGAFMDRTVLESDPHKVIEGMIIAAYAVGAAKGYIYVRAEYPLATRRLNIAIRQAKKYGLIGKNIAGSKFSFSLEVRTGAGAYVCGEETALIASIEGKRGNPRPRPPYPAQYGIKGYPTLINNVETFASIAPIIDKGEKWYSSIGTEKSKGTKVFSLSGNVVHTGTVEVPMGISMRELVFDIGGGIPDGKAFKAVQTGGPSGGCVTKEYLDTSVDYESMLAIGSIIGSGGVVVLDESTCMVDVAKYFIEFCKLESCGKCVPCRTGTLQLYDILHKICEGRATGDDIEVMLKLCNAMKKTSLCGLGQAAPNTILSTYRYFRDEYMAHIHDKYCPAGVCKILGESDED